MKKSLFIFSIAVLFIVFACSKKPESAASVEIIEGIEHVHNTETPLYPNKTVTLEEELSIGGEKYDMIFRPQSFIVDQNENIYISDFQDQSIKVFDPGGKHIKTIGRKGEGPGEFLYIGNLTFLPDGRLMVMDINVNRLSLFDSDGKYINSYHWATRPGRLHYATDSSCVLTVHTFEGDQPLEEMKIFVKKFDFAGNEIQSFGEFRPEDMKIYTEKRGEGGIAVSISPPYSPHSIFAADPVRQYLFHCVNDEYKIEIFDKDGKIIRKFDRPYEPISFTGIDAEEFHARWERSRIEGLKKIAKEIPMPDVKTITPRMLVDDEGNLWVETHEQKEEEAKVFIAYDIFNPDNRYVAKVWVDKMPEFFVKGKMYRMHTDEESGYRYIRRYRVVWSDKK